MSNKGSVAVRITVRTPEAAGATVEFSDDDGASFGLELAYAVLAARSHVACPLPEMLYSFLCLLLKDLPEEEADAVVDVLRDFST